jgi:HK97 family phage major capsid protein
MIKAPASAAGLEEDLNDPAKLKQLWENGPETLKSYIEGYAAEFAKADRGDVEAQIREQAQIVAAEALKMTRDKSEGAAPVRTAPADRGARARMTSAQRALYGNKHAPGRRVDGIFDDAADYFQATWHRADRLRNFRTELAPKLARLTEVQNSFGSEVPDAGGFLIPEILRSELLSLATESAVIRPRATVIPMNSLRVPIPIIDDTSHVSNIFGGVQWYWTEEAAALTESQATFGRVVLDAKKLTAYANVPNELLQDAPAFSGFFESRFPVAIAYGEDVAFFTGTGVGEPLGFINCPASVNVSKESGQATNTIVWENIVKMYARMLPTSLRSAVWVAAIDTFPELATMALSVGTGGGPVWLGGAYGNSSGADNPPMTILGRPVIFTEKANALSTAGDINFVDLDYYLIGDRMQMESMSSEHYKFANDQTSFRIIQRVDGRPWLQSALTPHNNSSSTLTAFVQLASR